MSTIKTSYRPDIDGLRALAVVSVVLYHAGFSPFSGGFVGVDVFFVISGYLITSIIAREIQETRFSLASFYERRARRLFPALFAVLFASFAASWWLLMPQEMEDFGESLATTALFSSNFLFYTESGYFDGPSELKPLLHTWSLAIEEQYYLVFPALLLWVHRRQHWPFLPDVAICFALSFLISWWSVFEAPTAGFYLLPSRMWELLLGSMLALAPACGLPRMVREALAYLALAAILWSIFFYTGNAPFPGPAALLPCAGTGLLIWLGTHQAPNSLKHAFAWGPVVAIGLISYSLYLWHWPILVFARHYVLEPLTPMVAATLVALSFALAALSWRFIEQPFRGARGRLNRQGIFRVSIIAISAAIALGLWMDRSEGAPGRLPDDVRRIAQFAEDRPVERKRCEGIDPDQLSYERVCRLVESDIEPSFLVWGDSHAMAGMSAFGAAAEQLGRNGLNASSNGCVPLLGLYRYRFDPGAECVEFGAAVLKMIDSHPELSTIILFSRWARHAEGTDYGGGAKEIGYLADAESAHQQAHDLQTNRALFHTALQRTLSQLIAMGRRVVVISPVPEIGRDVPIVGAKSLWRGKQPDPKVTRTQFNRRQSWVMSTLINATSEQGAEYVDITDIFCGAEVCRGFSNEGIPLYFDDNHLASTGAQRLVPIARNILDRP